MFPGPTILSNDPVRTRSPPVDPSIYPMVSMSSVFVSRAIKLASARRLDIESDKLKIESEKLNLLYKAPSK